MGLCCDAMVIDLNNALLVKPSPYWTQMRDLRLFAPLDVYSIIHMSTLLHQYYLTGQGDLLKIRAMNYFFRALNLGY